MAPYRPEAAAMSAKESEDSTSGTYSIQPFGLLGVPQNTTRAEISIAPKCGPFVDYIFRSKVLLTCPGYEQTFDETPRHSTTRVKLFYDFVDKVVYRRELPHSLTGIIDLDIAFG